MLWKRDSITGKGIRSVLDRANDPWLPSVMSLTEGAGAAVWLDISVRRRRRQRRKEINQVEARDDAGAARCHRRRWAQWWSKRAKSNIVGFQRTSELPPPTCSLRIKTWRHGRAVGEGSWLNKRLRQQKQQQKASRRHLISSWSLSISNSCQTVPHSVSLFPLNKGFLLRHPSSRQHYITTLELPAGETSI